VELRHDPHLLDQRPLVQRVQERRALRHRVSAHHPAGGPESRLDELEAVPPTRGVLDADEEHPPALLDQGPRGAARSEARGPVRVHGEAGERVAVEDGLGHARRGAVAAERHRGDLRGILRGQRGAEARELADGTVDAGKIGLRLDIRPDRAAAPEKEGRAKQQRGRARARDRDRAAPADQVPGVSHGGMIRGVFIGGS
jgi:hypothetical protein